MQKGVVGVYFMSYLCFSEQGTRQEFSNMFERPILNGQCVDSTPEDVQLMRYRSHVLHSLLEGFVQR